MKKMVFALTFCAINIHRIWEFRGKKWTFLPCFCVLFFFWFHADFSKYIPKGKFHFSGHCLLFMKIQSLQEKNFSLNSLSANPTKWLSKIKQFVDNTNSRQIVWVFDHFVELVLKGLRIYLWCVARFDIICTIFKKACKTPM